ncbi:hypothetical protein HK101_010583 [Irineochytrium annulatum]|nr:hypothetical protein HK101_010583 [Irineochytrium annulatum]
MRKERKIRPGFVSEEDVVLYTNSKIEASKLPVGYVPGMGPSEASSSSTDQEQRSKAALKNAKKREKRKEAANNNAADEAKPAAPAPTAASAATATAAGGQEDPEKKLRGLRKKLKQIEELEGKADLLPEQREKVARKKETMDEIKALEKALAKVKV